MTLRTLNYGNYGIFLIMGHAGFCPSTVVIMILITVKTIVTIQVRSNLYIAWKSCLWVRLLESGFGWLGVLTSKI